jgi:hypothetical protein
MAARTAVRLAQRVSVRGVQSSHRRDVTRLEIPTSVTSVRHAGFCRLHREPGERPVARPVLTRAQRARPTVDADRERCGAEGASA